MAFAHLHTVILNTVRQEESVTFWSAFLDVDVATDDPETRIVWLRPDTDGGVNIGFQLVDRPLDAHIETHLDLAVADLDEAQARVEALGGRVVAVNRLANGFEWRVMADTEHREFCLYAP